VVFDYIQLATARGGRDQSREQEVAAITRGLKIVAKDTRLPIIALSQLNRGLERRENRRPNLSDLRESGSLEQDADVVIFVHREYPYLSEAERNDPNLPREEDAELILAKNRSGDSDQIIPVRWNKQLTRFESRETRPGYVEDPDQHWAR
jgi:replicative DNA helicase